MNNHAGKILAALLGGAVVGAAVALLLAPKSGADLREEITSVVKEKYSHLNKEEITALVDKAIEKLKGCCCHCASDIEDAVSEAAHESKA